MKDCTESPKQLTTRHREKLKLEEIDFYIRNRVYLSSKFSEKKQKSILITLIRTQHNPFRGKFCNVDSHAIRGVK